MMILSSRNLCLIFAAVILSCAAQTTPAQERYPNPSLNFLGPQYAEAGGKQSVRYHFEVVNKDKYPAELFAAAPDLPPCGTNKNSARAWVDIYDQRGKRLQGFCAFTKPDDLSKIWFEMPAEEVPPSYVYIEITDRKTNTKYKSNLAETTM